MKLVSWNVNGRTQAVRAQCDAVCSRNPDLVALQEVTTSSAAKWRDALAQAGFTHTVDSFELAPDPALLRGPRKYGELLASRFPQSAIAPNEFDIPWPERVLSVTISVAEREIDVHVAHIPPGSSNGWIKIETLEGIFRRLSRPS